MFWLQPVHYTNLRQPMRKKDSVQPVLVDFCIKRLKPMSSFSIFRIKVKNFELCSAVAEKNKVSMVPLSNVYNTLYYRENEGTWRWYLNACISGNRELFLYYSYKKIIQFVVVICSASGPEFTGNMSMSENKQKAVNRKIKSKNVYVLKMFFLPNLFFLIRKSIGRF